MSWVLHTIWRHSSAWPLTSCNCVAARGRSRWVAEELRHPSEHHPLKHLKPDKLADHLFQMGEPPAGCCSFCPCEMQLSTTHRHAGRWKAGRCMSALASSTHLFGHASHVANALWVQCGATQPHLRAKQSRAAQLCAAAGTGPAGTKELSAESCLLFAMQALRLWCLLRTGRPCTQPAGS